MRLGLRFKLTVMVLLLISLVLLSIGLYISQRQAEVLLKNVLASAQREVRSTTFLSARAILDNNDLAVADALLNLSGFSGFVYAAVLSTNKTPITFQQAPDFQETEVKEQLARITEQNWANFEQDKEAKILLDEFTDLAGHTYYLLLCPLLHPFSKEKQFLGLVQLIFSDSFIRQVTRENQQALFWAALFFWLVGISGAFLVAHLIIKPIRELSKGAQKVGDGDLDYQVPDLGKDEIGALARQFNLMTAGLRQARQERESQLILNEQIKQAQEIQEGMNPMRYVNNEFIQMKGFTRAAKGVGGDYFDFQVLPNGRVAVLISDVSGKSISASLVMVLIKTVVSTYLKLYDDIRPDKVLDTINKVMCSQAHIDKFATILFYTYDPDTRELVFTNGGQGPLFLYRKKHHLCTVSKLEGLPMGVDDENDYRLAKVILEPGDLVVLYTDGITEAWNRAREEFGLARFRQKILDYASLDAKTIVEKIIQDIDAYADGAEQHDDMTLLVMKAL